MTSAKKTNIFLSVIILIFISHAIYLNCTAEDAFISFRYAKNLCSGYGLVWNNGESPVEGYTNFLWVILCALFIKLTFNVVLSAQIMGILAGVGTICYTYKFSRRILDCKGAFCLIPSFFLAISGPFATWSSSGMETNLFGLFLLMSCYYFACYWKNNAHKGIFFAYFFLFVTTLTRPEGFMIFSIVLAVNFILSVTQKKRLFSTFLLPVFLYTILFLVYFVWRWDYFGFLLPNTFYAKTGGAMLQYTRGIIYLKNFLLSFMLPCILSFIIFITIKIFNTKPVSAILSLIKCDIRKNIGIFICVPICVIYTSYIIYVGGDYMAMYRFFVPILPLIYILFGLSIQGIFSYLADFRIIRIAVIGLLLLAGTTTMIHSTPLEKRLFRLPRFQHGNFRGIETERWYSARLSVIGKFFDEYKKSDNESLATGYIGAISYYADMKIHSFHGIVDTFIAHQKPKKGKPLGKGLPGHEKKDYIYVLSKKPTYIITNVSRLTFLPPPRIEIDNVRLNEFIEKHYKLTTVWLDDPKNNEEGFFSFLELKK